MTTLRDFGGVLGWPLKLCEVALNLIVASNGRGNRIGQVMEGKGYLSLLALYPTNEIPKIHPLLLKVRRYPSKLEVGTHI